MKTYEKGHPLHILLLEMEQSLRSERRWRNIKNKQVGTLFIHIDTNESEFRLTVIAGHGTPIVIPTANATEVASLYLKLCDGERIC